MRKIEGEKIAQDLQERIKDIEEKDCIFKDIDYMIYY